MNLEKSLANHFGVSIEEIIIDSGDFGINSLTAKVNGILFDVLFNSQGDVTFSCLV